MERRGQEVWTKVETPRRRESLAGESSERRRGMKGVGVWDEEEEEGTRAEEEGGGASRCFVTD